MLPIPKPGIMQIAPYVAGKSVAASGVTPIKLSSNESALGASPKGIAAYQAAAAKLHRYPDGSAAVLREAIAKAYGIAAARIICGAGSDELIGLLVHAYAGEGDEVLYSQHGFLMYKIYAQGAGAIPVTAPERNLTADVDALLAAVTPRTKLLFLANPNNPTGSYLPQAEVERLRKNLPENVLLVLDAAYAEYADGLVDYDTGKALVEAGENTVMLRTFSKIYGLPALRIGWGYMPAAIADVLNRLRGPFNVSAPAIAAAAAAVGDSAHVEASRIHNTKYLKWLSDELRALGLKTYPSIANFLLAEFKDVAQAAAANQFLTGRGIIVRDVVAYGLPTCLRITIGAEDELRALVAALAEFLKS